MKFLNERTGLMVRTAAAATASTALAVCALTACASKTPSPAAGETLPTIAQAPPLPPPAPSTAELHGRKGSKVHGTVIITSEGNQVHLVGQIDGLKPNSEHGIHIHENGSCEGKGFSKAGAHFNPWSTEHGGADSKIRHAGDLGNIKADAKGHATLDIRIPSGPSVDTFGGKSIILHAKSDDQHSQPSGNSGNKIACGVIKQQTP